MFNEGREIDRHPMNTSDPLNPTAGHRRSPSTFRSIAPKSFYDIRLAAIEYVAKSLQKVSPVALKKYLSIRFEMTTRMAHRTVNRLVLEGELSYIYDFGSSYLEVSQLCPIRIGDRLVLVPPAWPAAPEGDQIILRVQTGAAFGCGRHPTTRLALRGLESALLKLAGRRAPCGSALDIGTGSGILAMAALKLGIEHAVGVDRDACARSEAVSNARLNGLSSRFEVTDALLTGQNNSPFYKLILANLRTPTLFSLKGTVAGLLAPGGALVLSGVKKDEMASLISAYAETGLHRWWLEEEKGWIGAVLGRSTPE